MNAKNTKLTTNKTDTANTVSSAVPRLLEELSGQGIEFWPDGDQLRYRGPRQVLTPSLLSQVKQNKAEILKLLKQGNYISKVFPLSYPQRSLWYIYQSAPESPAYNTAMSERLLFEVDIYSLKFALQTLLTRHPCLRTTFSMQEDKPVQKVHAYRELFFQQIDAPGWPMEELNRRVKEEHERPFDLEKGPVLRASLFTRDKEDHVLLISIHHIVCDGWSMWLLMEELWKIYLDKIAGQPEPPAPNRVHHLAKYPVQLPSLVESININTDSFSLDMDAAGDTGPASGTVEFREFIRDLLLNAFREMGVFQKGGETYDKKGLVNRLNILPGYYRLFEALLDIFLKEQLIQIKENEIIITHNLPLVDTGTETAASALREKKDDIIKRFPELEAYANLVWVCVSAFPAVLTGKQNHMEVMFPNGSMELVENTYKGNKVVDYFNHMVAEMVKTYIRERLRQDENANIRVLEVGAGTGGTSQFVLEAIKDYGTRNQVSYLYTDISPAFAYYGEKLFAERYPFVEFKTLNIEEDPKTQDFNPDSIDIIFASHVLHATRRIENTLNHLKRLLKTNGLLIINEMTQLLDVLTLTFGLTDGWWLLEDENNRIKGSPLLGPGQWQHLLEENGFRKIKFFGLPGIANSRDNSPQQVITAESDGLIKSKDSPSHQPGKEPAKSTQTYEDYVYWQAKMLDGDEGERQWNYWKKQLAGDLPLLNLPLDRPRPPVQTYRGNWYPFKINEVKQDLSGQLTQLAREKGVTLYTLLLCAYHILLHRYTGQDDILVGCPTTGRTLEAFNGIVGDFVNILVLRADFSDDPTANGFIEQMRRTILAAFDHQDYPFTLLVDRLNPKRDSNRPPVFQTMFVFQKPHNLLETQYNNPEFVDVVTDFYSGTARMKVGEFDVESFPISQQEGQFDMSIEITGSDESLKGVLKYNRDIFDDVTMKRMTLNFLHLLDCMVTHPGLPVSEIQFMSEKEKQQLLVEWNNTASQQVLKDIKCIHRLFEDQVKQTPDAIALEFNDTKLNYSQLNHRSNQLAHYLEKHGTKSNDRVGICIRRSFEMIIGIIGILKAGGVTVPLDPSYPRERLSLMIEDSQPTFLLVNHHMAELFQTNRSNPDLEIIIIDNHQDMMAGESGENLSRRVPVDNLLYILYTSGSTGKPKGVEMPHQPISNLIQWQNRQSTLSKHAKTLQFTTLSFDVSFQEIFSTLSSGGSLLLIEEELRQDPESLLRLMKTESVERLFTPFVFLQMLAETSETNDDLIPLSLREIITAGEQLRVTRSIIHLFESLTHCTLYNQYGPTEAHVVTSFTLPGNPCEWPQLPPIGKPIANTRVYILDRHLNPVPIGVTGEIYLGGICLARGYRNQPGLTDEKFIKDPFAHIGDNQAKLYRTGDLGRFLMDGNIEFLGRSDHQVKIRGFRVELAEIENQLLNHENINEAVVIDRENKNGIKSLCAYIVCEAEFSVTGLKDYLSGKIPGYMIPSYFVRLDKIPLLPNQKVDRLSLPQPEGSISTGIEYEAPGDDVEKKLVEIWQDILDIEKIGINDNLFDIGGNSLITLSVQRKIDEFYPGKIKIPDIIQHPTISSLARAIKTRESTIVEKSGREEQLQILLETIGDDN